MNISNLINPFKRANTSPPKTLLPFLQWALRGAWPVLILAALINACAGVLEVTTAYFLGQIIDAAQETGPVAFASEHWILLTAFVLFFILFRPAVFGLAAMINSVTVGPNVTMLVMQRLNRWVMGHSVTFFDDDFAGRIAQKQMQTARAISSVTVEVVNVLFFAVATIIGSLFLLTTIDYRIALLLAFCVVGYIALLRYFIPRVRKLASARAGARAMVTGQIVDTVTNIKTVKLFAHSKSEDESALDAMSGLRDKALEFGVLAAKFRVSLMTLAGFIPVTLIGGTIYLWTQGSASTGDIAAAGSVAVRLAQMTGWVSFALMGIYADLGEIEDGMRTLTPSYTLVDKEDAEPLNIDKATIEFRDIEFTYGRDQGGLNGVNLRVKAGEKLGVVGASGAGKSTMVSLLMRLYDPENGVVLVDGKDIRDLTQESLRHNIGMVTQETAMFNRSARENIFYGRKDASEDEMKSASKSAEADLFIKDLEDHAGRKGYDAHLGERGVKLSGGQRQRIALARAILKDAPILVLDEATSALDSEIEASIQAALDKVMAGKTVIAIAHRLSTIVKMDRIVVLDGGRIAEEGTHSELLALGGLYKSYWDRQSGGFIGAAD